MATVEGPDNYRRSPRGDDAVHRRQPPHRRRDRSRQRIGRAHRQLERRRSHRRTSTHAWLGRQPQRFQHRRRSFLRSPTAARLSSARLYRSSALASFGDHLVDPPCIRPVVLVIDRHKFFLPLRTKLLFETSPFPLEFQQRLTDTVSQLRSQVVGIANRRRRESLGCVNGYIGCGIDFLVFDHSCEDVARDWHYLELFSRNTLDRVLVAERETPRVIAF